MLEITYHNWDGDACRLHTLPDGNQSADLYRGGSGLVSISPVHLLFDGVEISEETYKELVVREIARRKPGVRYDD